MHAHPCSIRIKVIRSVPTPISRRLTMSDWTQRLAKVQASLPQEESEDVSHLTIEELKSEVMTFGKAHRGRTFEQVWNTSPEWTQWFLQHYQNSGKTSHKKMVRYIKLKIEEVETNPEIGRQNPVMPKSHAAPKAMISRPKAKAQPGPQMAHAGSEPRPDEPWMPSEDANVQNLQERMGMVENALQQILMHLAPTPVPDPGNIEVFPTMPIEEEWNDPWNQ